MCNLEANVESNIGDMKQERKIQKIGAYIQYLFSMSTESSRLREQSSDNKETMK